MHVTIKMPTSYDVEDDTCAWTPNNASLLHDATPSYTFDTEIQSLGSWFSEHRTILRRIIDNPSKHLETQVSEATLKLKDSLDAMFNLLDITSGDLLFFFLFVKSLLMNSLLANQSSLRRSMLVKSLLVNPACELLLVFLFVNSLVVSSPLANQCP